MYVLDATPLIYLAKAEQLALIGDLSATCVSPEPVYEEVVSIGIEQGYADARRVERAVENGGLEVVPIEEAANDTFDRLQRNQSLSEADAAVLAIADEYDATAIMDEQYGRDVADAEEIPTRGTAYLVLELLKEDVVTASEARETIDEMLEAGWYCAPNLYAKILAKIEDLSD